MKTYEKMCKRAKKQSNLQQLQDYTHEMWQNIPVAVSANLVKSYWKRLEKIIAYKVYTIVKFLMILILMLLSN